MSKKSRFRGPFDQQHVKWDQTVLISKLHQFYHIYWSLWRHLSPKKSFLLIGKISRLVLNTLTASQKYSLLNRDNLTQQTQMQLSLKEKTFFSIFLWICDLEITFWKFLQKKYDPHSWCIFEVTDSGNRG